MKVKKDIVNQRRIDIMKSIEENNSLTVEELVKIHKASPATIRRDLQYWQEQGAISKKYGRVTLIEAFVEDNDYVKNRYMKAIAKRAALYVEDGDVIFINASRTALMVAEYIRNKNVTIITNNTKATAFSLDPNVQLIMTGGEIGHSHTYLTGDFALSSINMVTATKCFIGCSGLKENGVSTGILREMSVNKAMLARTAGQKFILCDHSKVGLDHNYYYTDFSDIDYLITDVEADKRVINRIKQKNSINIIAVEPSS